MNVAGSCKSGCTCCPSCRSFHLQERLAEISAERAAKKLAAHQAAEQKLKEAAMPPRMQLAAQVEQACCHMTLLTHCAFTYACLQYDIVNHSHIALGYTRCCQVMLCLQRASTEALPMQCTDRTNQRSCNVFVTKWHQY